MIPIAKWLLRWKRAPLVNPAGGAILIITLLAIGAGYIFTDLEPPIISWWGTDMVQNVLKDIPVINYALAGVLLLGFWYFAWKFKKLPYVVSFYAVFLGSTYAWNIVNVSVERGISIAGMMLVNATAFFALVMLPEPKTSPIFPKGQIVIGTLAGGALFVANTWFGGLFIDPLILTLLISNFAVFGSKTRLR